MPSALDRPDDEMFGGSSRPGLASEAGPNHAAPSSFLLPNVEEQLQASSRGDRPRLLIFYSDTSGPCRRLDAHLAQILQRRRNHHAFDIVRLRAADRPKAVELLGITALPTLIVVQRGIVRARLESPRGRPEIEKALSPWLRPVDSSRRTSEPSATA
ncbi:MAG TPA: thioredoxin family protein [Gaiellaceae bacterium]|jgi:thioredoxin-like negative regulator of GroEL|nr:thioredoxin family protein [Gaiellaceae bacterium]